MKHLEQAYPVKGAFAYRTISSTVYITVSTSY